ncbi:DUF222 domain-containing protein [Actinomycetospora chibensis]|uniref:DUF222 domain-containing protein n=1 Tax=Actinomycetospora chibensis TaxID=663606 RepID=A0ABV9RSU1_9PSEU
MFDRGYATVVEEPRPSAVPLWSSWVPGPELAAALAGSEAVDLVDDEGHDAAERLAGWEAIANWATGHLYRETGEYLHARQGRVRGAGRAELVSEAVAMEVATLARVAPRTGEIRIHQAETLIDQLPRTLDALEAGQISMSHVRVVIEQTELCDPGTARAVDAELWSRPARDRTPTQLRALVRRIVTRLDPDLLRRRPEQARKDRDLRYWSDDHGATASCSCACPPTRRAGSTRSSTGSPVAPATVPTARSATSRRSAPTQPATSSSTAPPPATMVARATAPAAPPRGWEETASAARRMRRPMGRPTRRLVGRRTRRPMGRPTPRPTGRLGRRPATATRRPALPTQRPTPTPGPRPSRTSATRCGGYRSVPGRPCGPRSG